ncbi:LysE family transporter [Halobacillus shinanisalinarum]|uniref:LysE family transporter n=1 Tax=Halobacillus shinanisalinarum TaxID=2932258 RepID=A0ABY4GX30_9BACI|nr:LysE family transporter [Halobacillus shinanisalinarum]UOQ91967.1 LysE family transporter [Halobacillus shinanisalinarum]
MNYHNVFHYDTPLLDSFIVFKTSSAKVSTALSGFAVLGIISGIFTAGLYDWIPVVEPYFKVAGAVYLLYLAWQVSLPKGSRKDYVGLQSSFLSGFIFQVINVKSILFFLTVMSAFILPFSDSIKSIVMYLTLTIFLGWLALLLWSTFGSMLKNFLAKHDKAFRIIMGGLLICCSYFYLAAFEGFIKS